MSAPALHIFAFDNARAEHFGVFDENGDAPFDCEASGTDRQTARRIVASWNAMRHLTVKQIEAAHAIDADWHNHLCEWIGDAALNEIKKRYEKSRAQLEVV